jgi:hypothetical protein
VRRDNWQILDTLIQLPSDGTGRRLARQQPIRMLEEGRRGGHNPILLKTKPGRQ